jgi:hypothetical protein
MMLPAAAARPSSSRILLAGPPPAGSEEYRAILNGEKGDDRFTSTSRTLLSDRGCAICRTNQ